MAALPFLQSRVTLPGSLLVGESLAECQRFESLSIHPLTGREEDWLARSRHVPAALLTTSLIEACVMEVDDRKPPANFARRLLSGDRDFLVLQIRRLTLGDTVSAVAVCPACGKEMDVDFDSAAVPPPLAAEPHKKASYTITLEARGGEDPSSAREVRFRLPVGADQEAVAGAEAKMDIDAAASHLLALCVIDDGGTPLNAAEGEQVCAAMELVAPAAPLDLDLLCPECAHAFVLPFDIPAFFFEEMRINGRQLLKEVHALAFHYHWSEAEILGLVRERRRSYLALLRESAGEA